MGGHPHPSEFQLCGWGAPPSYGGAPPYISTLNKNMGGPPQTMGGPRIHILFYIFMGGAPHFL